jgi:hypothetical protein
MLGQSYEDIIKNTYILVEKQNARTDGSIIQSIERSYRQIKKMEVILEKT